MTIWDPYLILWLPHDADLKGRQVLAAYSRRLNFMYRVVDDPRTWPADAEKIGRAAWALRTRRRRRQVLADLVVQPGLLSGLGYDPARSVLADALLTPLASEIGLDQACDRRALERQAAQMRLESRADGRKPWPPSTGR